MKVVHREDKTAGAKKPSPASMKKVVKKSAPIEALEEAPVEEPESEEAEKE